MTIFVAIVGLGVLIFVHELGHFVVSHGLGMRPRRFYIGFPPAVWKMTKNGIEPPPKVAAATCAMSEGCGVPSQSKPMSWHGFSA